MDAGSDTPPKTGSRVVRVSLVANIALCVIKACAGVLGNSYALIADAIESLSDVFSSFVVFVGLRLAARPPDDTHPYGHGKFEPLAGLVVGVALLAAAAFIAIESVREIMHPHHAPAPFTLVVLTLSILAKAYLVKYVSRSRDFSSSTALQGDAAHHLSDLVTSAAAFVGISIAIIGGAGYEAADDAAALAASGIITLSALSLLRRTILELVDTAPSPQIVVEVRKAASGVAGVLGTHKCIIRKIGVDLYVDLDVLCDPEATIRFGHEVAHNVGEAIHRAIPTVAKVLVHVEPADDFGRRSRDRIGEMV
jgi:cation diffusion facilitator family transporter